MPVLIEAISVVVRRDRVDARFTGGWSAFNELVPNSTLCFDADLARIGFMTPEDVKAYVDQLEAGGLKYLHDGEPQDIALVDQLQGPLVGASWLETAVLHIDDFDGTVVVCRLVGSTQEKLSVPGRWEFHRSLSQRGSFMRQERADAILQPVRSADGVDVYINTQTGQEFYIGRTSKNII